LVSCPSFVDRTLPVSAARSDIQSIAISGDLLCLVSPNAGIGVAESADTVP
jgi:hypothetical protein